MNRDPLLATFVSKLPGYERHTVRVRGGLHMIRGNGSPHFSLTCDIYDARGRDVGGGAAHDIILAGAPFLKPLADLHLSDIDGAPMHASANAWYWAAGCDGSLGGDTQYHAGSGSSAKSTDECLRIFADHVRVSLDDAREVIAMLVAVRNAVPQYRRVYEKAGTKAATTALAEWCEAQRPRWKAEADKCIADLGLVVYGDPWPVAQAA